MVAMCFMMVWLGMHTRFFTRRYEGSCQTILQQASPNLMREAASPTQELQTGKQAANSKERLASR
jgi:hypothetical protein